MGSSRRSGLTSRPLPPSTAALTVGSVPYSVVEQTYNAFPKGTLTAVILVPPPPAAWASQPCIAVTAAEIGHVAKLLSDRFHPLDASYAKFAEVVHDDTGAAVILRIGLRAIAGSQGIGPPVIPLSGPVTYQGKPFWVFSFAPTPPARIYLLIAVPTTTTTTSHDDLDRLSGALSASRRRGAASGSRVRSRAAKARAPGRRGVRAVDDHAGAGARVVPVGDRRLVPARRPSGAARC